MQIIQLDYVTKGAAHAPVIKRESVKGSKAFADKMFADVRKNEEITITAYTAAARASTTFKKDTEATIAERGNTSGLGELRRPRTQEEREVLVEMLSRHASGERIDGLGGVVNISQYLGPEGWRARAAVLTKNQISKTVSTAVERANPTQLDKRAIEDSMAAESARIKPAKSAGRKVIRD